MKTVRVIMRKRKTKMLTWPIILTKRIIITKIEQWWKISSILVDITTTSTQGQTGMVFKFGLGRVGFGVNLVGAKSQKNLKMRFEGSPNMANQTCVWWTDLCHSGPVWQKLAAFWGQQKISQTFGERAFAKFRDKNAVFVNFCDKTLYL